MAQESASPVAELTFFTKSDCSLCDAAWYVVQRVCRRLQGVTVRRLDIAGPGNLEWWKRYRNDIPVVHLDGTEVFRHRVHEARLRRLLEAAGCTPRSGGTEAEHTRQNGENDLEH